MSRRTLEESAEDELQRLEARINDLIRCCDHYREENRLLRKQQEKLVVERAALIDKNEHAKSRVEAMVSRLKSMEHVQ